MTRSFSRSLVSALILSLAAHALSAASARADPNPSERATTRETSRIPESLAVCVAEHERGRLYKAELRLFESREALSRCAAQDCPVAIRADCEDWLRDVDSLIPSVVIVVQATPAPLDGVRVTIDGSPIEQDLTLPIELLPGRHHFRIELAPHEPFEQTLELAVGEKNRLLRVHFAPEPVRAAEPIPSPVLPTVQLTPPTVSRPTPMTTYLLGGAAIACAAGAGALAVSAIVDRNAARDRCAPLCAPHVRDSLDTRLFWADVTGVAALLLGGLAAYTYISRPAVEVPASTTAAALGVRISPYAAQLKLEGRF